MNLSWYIIIIMTMIMEKEMKKRTWMVAKMVPTLVNMTQKRSLWLYSKLIKKMNMLSPWPKLNQWMRIKFHKLVVILVMVLKLKSAQQTLTLRWLAWMPLNPKQFSNLLKKFMSNLNLGTKTKMHYSMTNMQLEILKAKTSWSKTLSNQEFKLVFWHHCRKEILFMPKELTEMKILEWRTLHRSTVCK